MTSAEAANSGITGRLKGSNFSVRLRMDIQVTAVVSLSQQYDEAQAAQRLLRQSAKRSSACRRRVVAAVMGAMNTLVPFLTGHEGVGAPDPNRTERGSAGSILLPIANESLRALEPTALTRVQE
jgi:hypothetical protein